MRNKWIIGTRSSKLARLQANLIKSLLLAIHPNLDLRICVMKTAGDRRKKVWSQSGMKGLFTKELSDALTQGEVDFNVHSMKDLPSMTQPGLMIAAVPLREEAQDVLVSKEHVLFDHLPEGAKIGTASVRRKAQLQHLRRDIDLVDVRGNVSPRIRKALEGPYDAVVLAKAGIQRLGLDEFITEEFSIEQILPAAGQGALALEGRVDDEETRNLLSQINHDEFFCASIAERAMLQRLAANCHSPIGAYGVVVGDRIMLEGGVFSVSSDDMVREKLKGSKDAPEELGQRLAEQLLKGGAADILKS